MIDREGVCTYVNRLLAELDAKKRSKQSVVLRLVIIFPCMTQERARDILDSGDHLAVVNGELRWVQ